MKKVLFLLLLFANWYNVNAQIITTIAGNGLPGVTGDGGPATAASLLGVRGIAIDTNGNLYICTWHPAYKPQMIKKVNAAGIISTIAGTDTSGFSGDGGPATAARLNYPENIETDKYGNVYIADRANNRIRKVDTFGIITTFAGNGSATASGDGGPATAAGLGSCFGICLDTLGNVYIGAGNKIRKVDTDGIITTFAGIGTGFYSGDGGPATAAAMTAQGQIAFDEIGNLYVAEGGNRRVRKINTSGIITTVAGTGATGSGGDGGPATSAEMNPPVGVFPDNCGNLYIADQLNNKIRVVNGSGLIKTFAGTGETGGFGGDGGAATAARLSFPTVVYLDRTGNIYIADFQNLRVRYIHMDSCRNTTGLATQNSTAPKLTVFPNPAAGGFTINLSSPTNEPAAVVITSMIGTTIATLTTSTNKETALYLHVPPGMYMVTVTTEHGRWMDKILIE